MVNASGKVEISLDGLTGQIKAGGNGQRGDLKLCAPGDAVNSTIHLNGSDAGVRLGGYGQNGDVKLSASGDAAYSTIHLDGTGGNARLDGELQTRLLRVGGGPAATPLSEHGDLKVYRGGFDRKDTIHLDGLGGNLRVDGYVEAGDVRVNGDIRFLGAADCAEDFDLAEEADSGTVMVIDEEGTLRQSCLAYDSRVAGVVAGAGEYRSGIILDSRPDSAPSGNRMPIALLGKVYCKVDASYAPIRAGDLLTTSPTPGCAMKAVDPSRALGALIGKALRPLTGGQGMIPILVGTR